MKAFKQILAFLAALALCLALPMGAFAQESGDSAYAELSWDDVMDQLLAQYDVSPENIAAGYLNLVTGEEHYYNGDEYRIAASMYKLPLCMYFTEHLASGDIDWSDYENAFSYKEKQDRILLDSNNEDAEFLCDILGGYSVFRDLTADYMGMDPGTESANIVFDNMYTPWEFIQCLRLLYTERERFPDVIETMQQAEPEHYFKLNERRFEIAHKYGYISTYGVARMNDCGIAFTSQPIALVLFTQGVREPETFLSAYCTAMCEYTEAQAAKPEPTPEPTPALTPEPTPDNTAAPVIGQADTPTDIQVTVGVPALLPVALIGLFTVLAIVIAVVFKVKYKARLFTLLLSILFGAAAMLLAAVGMRAGTVYAQPSGDPTVTVERFFTAIESGDYTRAYSELRDYSDLGLSEQPSSAAGRLLADALHRSYSHEITGECVTRLLDGVQPVRFTYLNLSSLDDAVAEQTRLEIEQIVQTRSVSEVYDENRRYLPAVTEEAYLAALEKVLSNASDYYAAVDLDLELTYTDGRWQILASPALLRALSGGTAY